MYVKMMLVAYRFENYLRLIFLMEISKISVLRARVSILIITLKKKTPIAISNLTLQVNGSTSMTISL